jgi:hypothetical protein
MPGNVHRVQLFRFFFTPSFCQYREKREAYRNSEFAMRVLADHGIPVVMKVSPCPPRFIFVSLTTFGYLV